MRDGDDLVLMSGGHDIISGGRGSDVLLGGDGNDTLIGGRGNDLMTGGDGSDVFHINATDLSGFESDTVTDFTPGLDKLALTGFGDIQFTEIPSGLAVFGASGGFVLLEGLKQAQIMSTDINGSRLDLAMFATRNVNRLSESGDRFVTTSNDPALAQGNGGDDAIVTSGGADTLDGGTGSDLLIAGAGNDVLIGGPGNDILSGGPGNDRFVFASGTDGFVTDTISDFDLGTDQVLLEDYGPPTLLEISGNAAARLSASEFILFKGISFFDLVDAAETVFLEA